MVAFFKKKNRLVRFTAIPVKRKNFNRENHYRNRRERDHNDGHEIHISHAFQIIVSRKKISNFFFIKNNFKNIKIYNYIFRKQFLNNFTFHWKF